MYYHHRNFALPLISEESVALDIFKMIACAVGVGLLVTSLLTLGVASLQLNVRAPDVLDWI
jgi:hypothetical protein